MIDIYYLHNPEISMMVLGNKMFYSQLSKLFQFFEEQVEKGVIRFYGLATWKAFLIQPNQSGYISLEKVVEMAKSIGGESHHFKFIQFPLNRMQQNSILLKNQWVGGS